MKNKKIQNNLIVKKQFKYKLNKIIKINKRGKICSLKIYSLFFRILY